MLDFDVMLESKSLGPFFLNLDTIKDLHGEQRRIASKINILYLLTFLGALLVLSVPLPSDTKISFVGIEAPISSMPQQVISVMMAVSYGMFGTLFASAIILTNMNATILRKEGFEGQSFIGARFDASTLWATMMTPRTIGYKSPNRHMLISILILLVTFLPVATHAIIIAYAAAFSFLSALQNGSWILSLLGGLSSLIVLTTILSIILSIFLPLPFRLNETDSADQGIL